MKARKLKPITKARRALVAMTRERDDYKSRAAAYLSTVRQQSEALDGERRNVLADQQLNRLRYILADIIATYRSDIPAEVADEIEAAATWGTAKRRLRPMLLRDLVVSSERAKFGAA